jgi:outer membrane protein assembly factor BamB
MSHFPAALWKSALALARAAGIAGALALASGLPAPSARAGEPGEVLNNPAFIDVNVYAESEIENAVRLEREGRFQDALVQYLQVRRRFPDHLHLFPEDGQGYYALFVPIRAFVDRRILEFPPDVRGAHFQSVDPYAAPRFQALRRDPGADALRAFLAEHDVSSWGPPARILLGDLLAERGDFLGALQAWQPLLERGAPSAELVRRLGFCYRHLGFQDSLARLASRDWPGARELASKAAQACRPREAGPVLPEPGAVAADLRWFLPVSRVLVRRDKGRTSATPAWEAAGGAGEFPPLFPRVLWDTVFLNLGFGLLCLRISTGKLAADPPSLDKVSELLGEDAGEPDGDEARDDLRQGYRQPFFLPTGCSGAAADLAIREGLLVAAQFVPAEREDLSAWRLAAFSTSKRGEGLDLAPLWTWTPGLPSILLSPAPALDGDRVFVGFGEIAPGTQDAHQQVACLDARTGRELWRTFVSAFSGAAGPVPEESQLTPPSTPLVFQGMVFHQTNMGTTAALDAATGAPRWLFKYAIPEKRADRDSIWTWFTNPLVQEGETLVATPRDHSCPFALDPSSGRPLWSLFDVFRSAEALRDAGAPAAVDGEGMLFDLKYRYSLGISEGLAVFTAQRVVYAHRAATGTLEWCTDLGEDVTGRGLLARGRIWVPTRTGVAALDLRNGKRARGGKGNYLLEWEEVARACRKTAEGLPPDATPAERRAYLEEPILGGNLLAVSVPRTQCRAPGGAGGRSCRGQPAPSKDGGWACPACGRRFASGEETCLIVAGTRHVFCCALEAVPEPGKGR